MPVLLRRRTLLALAPAGLAGLLTPGRVRAQEAFTTEITLAVDTARIESTTIRRTDEERLEAALKRRLKLFTRAGDGTVRLEGLSNIKVHIPVERVTPAQLQALTRSAQLHVYHLEDRRTGEHPDGRYEVSVLSIRGGGREQSGTRFFDLKERKPLQPAEFFKKCPLLLTTADVHPDGANVVDGNGLMAVRVQFNNTGTRKLEGFLRRRGEILGVVLDGEIISMTATTGERPPKGKGKRRDPDSERAIPQLDIIGGFNTPEEAGYLATLFNAGALPFPLKVIGTQLRAEKPG